MSQILKLVPPPSSLEQRKADARAVLSDANELGAETVIVFAYKDGDIYIRSSAYVDRLKLIGALEVAKIKVWNED